MGGRGRGAGGVRGRWKRRGDGDRGRGHLLLCRVRTTGVQPDAAPVTSPVGLAHLDAAVATTRFTITQIPPRWKGE